MTAGQGFVLHPEAALDITEVWEFIVTDNPLAARRSARTFLTPSASLCRFHQGQRRTDLTSRRLRFQIVRNYLIAYAPDEKPLLVLAVLHARRSPRVMAAVLRGREEISAE